jgi:hypothetical protein
MLLVLCIPSHIFLCLVPPLLLLQAGFAQLGLSMQLPASSHLSKSLDDTSLGVAFIPSNKALAAHLLSESAVHCRADPLSTRCAGSPQQLLQQVAPGAAAPKAQKQDHSSNSSGDGEDGGMIPYGSRQPGMPLGDEAALKVIRAAAAQPAKVASTLMRHGEFLATHLEWCSRQGIRVWSRHHLAAASVGVCHLVYA